jgi:hypothetical protein
MLDAGCWMLDKTRPVLQGYSYGNLF